MIRQLVYELLVLKQTCLCSSNEVTPKKTNLIVAILKRFLIIKENEKLEYFAFSSMH